MGTGADRREPWTADGPRHRCSVWATGRRDLPAQLLDGHYVADTWADQQQIPPAVAAHAIRAYSLPGALVVDPDCGAGTVVVEAVRAGRQGVGITGDDMWWPVARANLTVAKRRGAWPHGAVLEDKVRGRRAYLEGVHRRADLVLTTLRIPGVLDGDGLALEVERRFRRCAWFTCPGGYVVVVVRQHRYRDGSLVELPSVALRAARAAGLTSVAQCVALTARTRVIRSGRWVVGRRFVEEVPIGVLAHHDVLVLRAPDGLEGVPEVAVDVACGRAVS
jgi:modification methylase